MENRIDSSFGESPTAAAPASTITDEEIERRVETELAMLVVRQQELIVQLMDHLNRAMDRIVASHCSPRMSLRAEVDEMLSALASITPDDLARVATFTKSLFHTLNGCGAVGGGAARSQS